MNAPLDFTHEFRPGTSGRTLLLLHGTGGDESSLLDLGRRLDPDAALLSPRGKVLENGMPRFFRRLAVGVLDEEDLKRRASELAGFVEAAVGAYGLDAGRVVALGYSNGANIAAGLLLLRPDVLRGAILFRPMVPLVPDRQPDLTDVDVLVTAGFQDPLTPVDQVQQLVAMLSDGGARVAEHFLEAGHELTSADIDAARDWLRRVDP